MDTSTFRIQRLFPTAFALVILSTPIPAATIYDAVADFSSTTNPNGVWAYGRNSGTGGAFSAFSSGFSGGGIFRWWHSNDSFPNNFPFVGKTTSGAVQVLPTLLVPADVLYMAPGPNFDAIVQFTAVNTGLHSFSGSFLGLQQPFDNGLGTLRPGATVLVSAQLNGSSSLLGPTALQGPTGSTSATGNGDVPINFATNLLAGDTVLFRVNFGPDFGRGDFNIQGDSVGLRLTVNAPDAPTPGGEIPEPSSVILALAGLTSLVIFRRQSQS